MSLRRASSQSAAYGITRCLSILTSVGVSYSYTPAASFGSVVAVTPKIILYTVPPSQNAVRPELALLEKGVPFDKVQVDFLGGEHKQPAYGEITPRRQVPTLVYGEGNEAITLYESVAIIHRKGDRSIVRDPNVVSNSK